eukprot:9578671-Heterocapsa_arctica.AAC.1
MSSLGAGHGWWETSAQLVDPNTVMVGGSKSKAQCLRSREWLSGGLSRTGRRRRLARNDEDVVLRGPDRARPRRQAAGRHEEGRENNS